MKASEGWTQEWLDEYQARRASQGCRANHTGYVPLLAHSREIAGKGGRKADPKPKAEKKGKIERHRGYVELTHHGRVENGRTI